MLAVYEDVHWADPSTLELLGMLVEQAPTASMLHVLTFRPDFVPPWPPRSHMTPLTLNRLDRPQVEALHPAPGGGQGTASGGGAAYSSPGPMVCHCLSRS